MAEFDELQTRLGYRFRDPDLLRLALTHPSVAHELGSSVQTNQRLEFLGDAVLQLVLTRALYDRFPRFGEGPLTKARALADAFEAVLWAVLLDGGFDAASE